MQPVYTFLATLVPRQGDSPESCFDRLVGRLLGWVADAYPDVRPFPAKPDGVTARPAPDDEVTALREAVDSGHELFDLN